MRQDDILLIKVAKPQNLKYLRERNDQLKQTNFCVQIIISSAIYNFKKPD